MTGIINKDGFSQNYNTMKEYVNTLKDISNSPGYLVKNFSNICEQINSVNNMMNNLKSVGLCSIKEDLLEVLNNSTDWKFYKNQLLQFLKQARKEKTIIKFPKQNLEEFNFEYDNSIIPELSSDEINNMFLISSEIQENDKNIGKKIRAYNDNKNFFEKDLDEFLESIPEWENSLVNLRQRNIPILTKNIEILYEIHKKYVYEIVKKIPSSFEKEIDGKTLDCIKYKNKIIPLDNSQSKFIKNAIKIMLE